MFESEDETEVGWNAWTESAAMSKLVKDREAVFVEQRKFHDRKSSFPSLTGTSHSSYFPLRPAASRQRRSDRLIQSYL